MGMRLVSEERAFDVCFVVSIVWDSVLVRETRPAGITAKHP